MISYLVVAIAKYKLYTHLSEAPRMKIGNLEVPSYAESATLEGL